jgi:hypothetical protein
MCAIIAIVSVGLAVLIISYRRAPRTRIDRSFPSNQVELSAKVNQAINKSPAGTFILALESYGLPHGGSDDIWVELGENGGRISHRCTHYRESAKEAVREITSSEVQVILEEIEKRDLWNLPHDKHRIFDGFICAIVIGTGDRLHSIQMHYGEGGKYWNLIDYIHSLSPFNQ